MRDEDLGGQLSSIPGNVSILDLQSIVNDLRRHEETQGPLPQVHITVPMYVWYVFLVIGLAIICAVCYRLCESADEEAGVDDVPIAERLASSRFRMLLLVRAVTAGTSIGEGYAIGVVGIAIVLINEELRLSAMQTGLFLGVTYFFIAFGAPLGGVVADQIGRKPIIAASYFFIIAGSLMMGFAQNFEMLFIGRMLEAVGFGIGLSVVTTYLAEVAPTAHRGHFASLEEPFLLFGALFGNVNGRLLLHVPNNWRWLVGIGAFLPAIMLFCITAMPESPRYLALHGHNDEAKTALLKFVEEVEAEDFLRNSQNQTRQAPADWAEVLCPQRATRRWAVAASVGVMMFQMLSGITVIGMHLPMLLKHVMSTAAVFEAVIVLGFVRIIFAFIGSLAVDELGRLPLFIVSTIGLTFSLALLGFAWYLHWSIAWKLGILAGYLASYEIGLGPVAWVYTSEVLDTKLRSKGTALALCCSRWCAGCLVVGFPMLSKLLGDEGPTFLILAAINVCGIFFVILCVPETKGMLLEALEEHVFVTRLVARRETTGTMPDRPAQNKDGLNTRRRLTF